MSKNTVDTKGPFKDPAETDPRAAEAAGNAVEIKWKGVTFTIPRNYRDWPHAYILNAQKGLTAVALEALLGPEQHFTFMLTNPTIADFEAFDIELGKAIGTKPGESPASSD